MSGVIQIGDLRKAAYKLQGRMKFGGLDVSIENRKGSVRKWYDKATNTHGITKMVYPYGYVRGSIGSDGDHVDVFIGPNADATHVFIIDQMRAPDFKTFDEQKIMLGWDDADKAKAAYLQHFDKLGFFGKMKAMPFAEFSRKVLSTSAGKPLVKGEWAEQLVDKIMSGEPIGNMVHPDNIIQRASLVQSLDNLSETQTRDNSSAEQTSIPERPGAQRCVVQADRLRSDGLFKAGPHKYTSRKRDAKGRWRYTYDKPKKGALKAEYEQRMRSDVRYGGPIREEMDLSEAEQAIAKLGIEHAVVFGSHGQQLVRATSHQATFVQLTPTIAAYLRENGNAVFTHNHPSGNCLGIEDINYMVRSNLKEMRACGPHGDVFVLRRPKDGWGIPDDQLEERQKGNLTLPPKFSSRLQAAERDALTVARDHMDSYMIRKDGVIGDPKDPNYSEERWVENGTAQRIKQYERYFGWEVQREKIDRKKKEATAKSDAATDYKTDNESADDIGQRRSRALRGLAATLVVVDDLSKAGPFIGPRGGKWADAAHTIPYREGKGRKKGKPEDKKGRRKAKPKVKGKKVGRGVEIPEWMTGEMPKPDWKQTKDGFTAYGGRLVMTSKGEGKKQATISIDGGPERPLGKKATFDDAEGVMHGYVLAERRRKTQQPEEPTISEATERGEAPGGKMELPAKLSREANLSSKVELEPGKSQSLNDIIQSAVKTYGKDFVKESVERAAKDVARRADTTLRERAAKAGSDKQIQELVAKAYELEREIKQRVAQKTKPLSPEIEKLRSTGQVKEGSWGPHPPKPATVQKLAEMLRKDEYAYQLAEREAREVATDSIMDMTSEAVLMDKTAKPGMGKAIARTVLKSAAGPFVFGFIDNFLLYLAGSGIDHSLAVMGFSTAAVAGLGNAVSDSVGQAASDKLDRVLEKIGLRGDEGPSPLSEKAEKRIKAASAVAGVFAGALVGMVPLLFGVTFGKSARFMISADVLFKADGPPGSGWHVIPGGKKGGFRRKTAKGYEYWYRDGKPGEKRAEKPEPGQFTPVEYSEVDFAAGKYDRDPSHWQFVRLVGQTTIVGWTQGGVDPKSLHPVKIAGMPHRLYQVREVEAEAGWARLINVNDATDSPLVQHDRVYPVKHGPAAKIRKPVMTVPKWEPGQSPSGPKTGPVMGVEKTIPSFAESRAKKGSVLSKVESGTYPKRDVRYFAEDANGVPRMRERTAMAISDADKMKLINEFAGMLRVAARNTIKTFGIQKTSETEADLRSAAMEGFLNAIDSYPGGMSFAKHAKFIANDYAKLHAAREFAGGVALPKRHARLIRGFIAARAEAARIYDTHKPNAEQVAQVWKLHKRDIHEGLITGKNEPLPLMRYGLRAGEIVTGKDQAGKIEWAEHLGAFIDGQAKGEGSEFFDSGVGLYEGHGVAGVGMSEHEKIGVRHDLAPVLDEMRNFKWTEGARTYKVDAAELIKRMIGLEGEPQSAAAIAKDVRVEFLSRGEFRPLSERAIRRMVPMVFERAISELRSKVLRPETKGLIERAIKRAVPEQPVSRGLRWGDRLTARAKALTREEIKEWRGRQREILKRAEQVAVRDGDMNRAVGARKMHDRIKTIGMKRARVLAAEYQLRSAPRSAEWFKTAEALVVERPAPGTRHAGVIVSRTHPGTGAQQRVRVHSLSGLRTVEQTYKSERVLGTVPDIGTLQLVTHFPLLSKLMFGSDDPIALAPTLDREVALELMGFI